MKTVSILLIGAGGYGENYVKEMLSGTVEGTTFLAVADPFIQTSAYKAQLEEKGVKLYESPEAFYLDGGKADLAIISSPIHTHYSYIMACLKAGSNVLCEKPVTIDEGKMKALIEAEEKSGKFVAIGYQMCFQRDLLALKKDVMAGLFGAPKRMKAIRMMRRTDSYYRRNGWSGKLSCHGEYIFDSPLSNACAHQAQNMLFLLGKDMENTAKVESVDGVLYKARVNIENFDAAAIKIETDCNVPLYYYTAHCLDEKKVGPFGEFEFEKATIIDENDRLVAHFADGSEKDYGTIDKGLRLQKLYDAVTAVREGTRPVCTLKTAFEHTRLVIMTEKLPVYLRYDAEVKSDEGDGYYAIKNLATDWLSCYRSWSLPEIR
jgi:Predicted dehydrogenases and related proteins